MKNHQSVENRKSKIGNAFTLIELLVVIAIIAVLAGFTIPVMKSVKRTQYISHTKAEMGLLETAIQRYHDAYGFYPPGNPNYNPNNSATSSQAMFSPLYFELLGTTNSNPSNPNNGTYYTLDASASISGDQNTMTNGLGVGGFINCTKSTAEDAIPAKSFLSGLKPNQFNSNFTNNTFQVTVLLGSVGGPDPNYPASSPGLNPWRYVSPGVNNPNSYDLWIQLVISGKTNLVCNWSSQVQINSPLP
jgi:prepilin-type N-terminal cleavage/methylation domain-containing protein